MTYNKLNMVDTPKQREGKFIMARTPEKYSKMLWMEGDKVYDFKPGALAPMVEEVSDEPYLGEWEYWRAVSSFDF